MAEHQYPVLFSLAEIRPRIYRLEFDDAYDLAMHFWRVQEYHESPAFAGHLVTLIDYMDWYSSVHGKGAFTYPKDWSGFNVPSSVLFDVYVRGQIPDPNSYDEFMRAITALLRSRARSFYLIGTSKAGYKGDGKPEKVLSHEIAHGLYCTNDSYREAMDALVSLIPSDIRSTLEAKIRKLGYHENVVPDELQAYAATGPCKGLKKIMTKEFREPFIETFKEFEDVK